MTKRKLLSIADLKKEPEQTIKEKSFGLMKTFGQGSAASGVIFFIMWCLTANININEALKMIVGGSLALIGLMFFTMAKYFWSRLTMDEHFLVEIATKHRDAQINSMVWQEKYTLVMEENNILREDITIQLKELNRVVLDLACEKQKGFEKEHILLNVEEAIKNANK